MDANETAPRFAVPRTPVIESPPGEWVLASPVFRPNAGKPLYDPESLGGRGAVPAVRGAFRGELALTVYGLVFVTTGSREGTLQRLGEAAHHVLMHAVYEAGGVAGMLVAGSLGKLRHDKAFQAALRHPETFIIPAPQVVDMSSVALEGAPGRAAVRVTAEDDTHHVAQYWVAPPGLSGEVAGRVIDAIWIVRLQYELAFLLGALLQKILPQESQQSLLPEFTQAWFVGTKDELDRWEAKLDEVLKPANMTFSELKLEAYYHIQRFRKVPIVADALASLWEVFAKVWADGYRPTCFQCWTRAEAGAQVCPACGTPLY
jgi:hypothetical protein